jgi:single-strand DNA-binding protein
MNKVILIGRLGRDPETRYTANGAAVVTFSVATTERYKDKKTGQRAEETEWHRLVAYDRLGETVATYLKKGSQCYCEGRIKTRKWQDKDGNEKYSMEIVLQELEMLGDRGGSSDAPQDQPVKPLPVKPATSLAEMDDDIPF